jgi:hypothetical protein
MNRYSLRMVIAIVAAVGIGLVITYIDSRPNWDDTGITAAMLFAASFVLASINPTMPWLWALCIGIWIPIRGIVLHQNYGALLALIFVFVGAYAGMGVRRAISLRV